MSTEFNKTLIISDKPSRPAIKLSITNIFEAITLEWYNAKISDGSKNYAVRAFNKYVFPYPGSQPVEEIKLLKLLSVLQRMEKRGAPELASKVSQRCSEVFRQAIITVTGRITHNF